ncbi:superoxide dismutase family protein [Parasphingorhabdus litoris]|uniref:Superoxide dismutase family protein n=1 Tax=Parasphingorhabdus litoris TaxID=394733 RepID=A0ABN1A4G9_9SPHN|nr:superoxide dismutase family protein [Parasphingorhabdus litoris]
MSIIHRKPGNAVLLLAGLSLALGACSGGGSESGLAPAESIARATLMGADQAQYGEVIIGEGDGGLIVRIDARGLGPGPRGVHIHETGKCEGPDFKSAGGHWNPTNRQHGFDNPQGAHMGDLLNLVIGDDGFGSAEATIDGASLKEGSNALIDADGAAFIVHAGPDDMKTDPSGESGGRIACGVFELQKFEPTR